MSTLKPSITCKTCGNPAEYDSHRGVYRCQPCLEEKNRKAMARAGKRLQPVAPEEAPEPTKPQVLEVPIEELEQRLIAAEERPCTAEDVTLLDCRGCGAQVEVLKELAVAECLFCGRKTKAGKGHAKLESSHRCLIPFGIGHDEAVDAMRVDLGNFWLRPSFVLRRVVKANVRKVYVPFWAFDVQVTTDWNGTADIWTEPGFWSKLFGGEGHYKKTPIRGHRAHLYDDWLVCASHGVHPDVVRQMEPFHTGKALPMSDQKFEETPLEVAPVGPRRAWTSAQPQIRRKEYRECQKDARSRGGVESNDKVTMAGTVKFGEPKGKSAVLPLYIFSMLTLWGRAQIVVNGETGKVGSRVPFSWFKVIPLALLAIAGVIGVCVASGGLMIPVFVLYCIYHGIKEWKKDKRDEATFLEAT